MTSTLHQYSPFPVLSLIPHMFSAYVLCGSQGLRRLRVGRVLSHAVPGRLSNTTVGHGTSSRSLRLGLLR